METILTIFGVITIIIIIGPALLGSLIIFGIDVDPFGIDKNKNIATLRYMSFFILPLIFLLFSNYIEDTKKNHNIAECILNYNFYSDISGNIKEECITPNSNRCKKFLLYNSNMYSVYSCNIYEKYKSPIISCLDNYKVQSLYDKINYSSYSSVINGLSNIEEKSKNCVYLNSNNNKVITNNLEINIEECYFNGKYYKLPENAHCKTLSKINAWECNDGYTEYGDKCIIGIRKGACNIKGNISYNSKTKVYYLPSCGRYNDVEINPLYGEKWFCGEQEAINSGWIKARSCY